MPDPNKYRSRSPRAPGNAGWLLAEYSLRQKRNPRYSRRAFARRIGLSSGSLTDLFSGKRLISERRALGIARRLQYDERKTAEVMREVSGAQTARRREKLWSRLAGETRYEGSREAALPEILDTNLPASALPLVEAMLEELRRRHSGDGEPIYRLILSRLSRGNASSKPGKTRVGKSSRASKGPVASRAGIGIRVPTKTRGVPVTRDPAPADDES